MLKDWLNTDKNPKGQAVFLDATKTFPLPDESFDYVYAEHLIEHLTYEDGARFAYECHRVLRPNGKLRVSTPDLRFLLHLYTNNKTELQESYIKWSAKSFSPSKHAYSSVFVINNFFRAWGHKFIYDFETLVNLLTECGFVDITRFELGKSDDKSLQNIESHGLTINQEFNRLESMVVEARMQSTRTDGL